MDNTSFRQSSKTPQGFSTKFTVLHGDITKLPVDVIVNATDHEFSGGGGVDQAIHGAAGKELKKECQGLGRLKTGEAKITKGYDLPAKYVIHTVGPAYGSEDGEEDELLSACYTGSLYLAMEHNLETIAFPNISTGVFRYPKDEAVEIAFHACWRWVKEHDYYKFKEIVFVSFTEEDYELNEDYLDFFRFM